MTVAISITNGAVLTTTTNAATGAQVLASVSVRLPHVVDLKVGPSAAWTSAVTANVSFNSRGMRSGGPGPTLNQELAMVNDKGVQFAMKVTPARRRQLVSGQCLFVVEAMAIGSAHSNANAQDQSSVRLHVGRKHDSGGDPVGGASWRCRHAGDCLDAQRRFD